MGIPGFFGSIRYLLKPEEISIDNWVFKLHYRVTVLLLLASSAIGVSKQYFGDPINCQVGNLVLIWQHSLKKHIKSVCLITSQ